MWNDARGFMAIWSDVEPDDFTFYHDWLLKEHFPERVGVPGFLNARVFRRPVETNLQFFIIYETEGSQVLASAAYVERLNNPTPKSQKAMPKLKNFARGAGRVVQSTGIGGGGAARAIRFGQNNPALNDPAVRDALFKDVAAMDRVLAIRLFDVDADATTIQTEEKKIRIGKEEIYSQLLVIEAVDLPALESITSVLKDQVLGAQKGAAPIDHSYQLIAELRA